MSGRRAARRTALVLLYQWDVTGQELASLFEGETPVEVAINEAVALAKRYSSEDAGKLVNGILGRIEKEAHA